MSHFQLATYASGTAGLKPLEEVLYHTQTDPFPATYQGWTDVPGDDNLGRPIRAGYPFATWHWEWLSQRDVDTLLGYEGQVYFRTEIRSGQIRSFGYFSADLVVTDIGEPVAPANGPPFYPQPRGPIECEFRNLVAVTP